MNDLTVLSDAELDKELADLKERELALTTKSGKGFVESKMRECIGWLQSIGYKFEGDETALAKLWSNTLQEEFVRIGETGIKNAVVAWASEDESNYRMFPKVAWIKEACKGITGDPRVEKGRRVQQEAERQMELEHQREMQKFKEEHPDEWAKALKRAARST